MSRTYWRDEDGGSTYYGKFLQVRIHRRDLAWYVSCHNVHLDGYPLSGSAVTLADAKREALTLAKERLQHFLEDIDAARKTMKE